LKPSTMTSEEKRDAITEAAEDKKANYLTAIDLRGKTLISDFFIICSGTSNIHIRAVADGIMESLEKQGVRQNRIEGYSEAAWVLLDYGDVIVHIMSEDQRSYYKLEKLWTGEPGAEDSAEAPPAIVEDDADTEDDDADYDLDFEDDEFEFDVEIEDGADTEAETEDAEDAGDKPGGAPAATEG
jgi:ribosome-associated protein